MAEPESREDNIYFARLSEQGERYEDMIRYMKNVANVSWHNSYFLFLIILYFLLQYGQNFTNDERNLLSVAYKNSVKTRRDAWRTIQAIYNKEELKVSDFKVKIDNFVLSLFRETNFYL